MGKIITGSIDQTFAAANCLATDAVEDLVYVTGPQVAGRIQVAKIDITLDTKMPAVGMIYTKSSPTVCNVLLWGVVSMSFALAPGKIYFASASAGFTTTVPLPRSSYLQAVGQAIDESRMFLRPSLTRTKLV